MSFANDNAQTRTGGGHLRLVPAAGWSRLPTRTAAARTTVERDVTRRPAVEMRARNHPSWQSWIDDVSSWSHPSGVECRNGDGEQLPSPVAFDAFRTQCRDELRPVLEKSTAMLKEWGLRSQVIESVHDRPKPVARTFELGLQIDRFGTRGPGTLTLRASETQEHVHIKIVVGPGNVNREVHEHVGTARVGDLSSAMMGGLVATLVERVFSS